MIKKVFFGAAFSIISIAPIAQNSTGFDYSYQPIQYGNVKIEKSFYLLTAIMQSPELIPPLSREETLLLILGQQRGFLHSNATKSSQRADSLVQDFIWKREDSLAIDQAMRNLYNNHRTAIDRLVNTHLRPSGYYQRFMTLSNLEFWLHAWGQTVESMNTIINHYGLGKQLRYPAIDSASYVIKNEYYGSVVKNLLNVVDEQASGMQLFYEPSLRIALGLLDANDRDEAVRYEPLEKGENRAAIRPVEKTNWAKYSYSAILVPGEGPEIAGQLLSPGGKLRCELAALRFKKGVAPFIIVSGGNVHPFHTPYNEAYEMKQYLMKRFFIPETAIIIEPQARHTTTNFRNASRLIIRYGMPVDKPALCVTTVDQADYIEDLRFDARNIKELGYVPYIHKKRISIHEIEFYPVLESLHTDPNDPLDP